MAHPRYMQVAEEIRQKITDGTLSPGTKLPNNRELATTHGVAVATLSRALEQLQVEGLIRSSQRGTFVTDTPSIASSGHDRTLRVMRTGSALAEGESVIVTSAELVIPPVYVGEIYGIDPGDQVVRREWHVGSGTQRRGLYVTWYPAAIAALVPDLLSRSASKVPGLLLKISKATGRTPTHGRDDMHSRDADEREANYLGVKVGTPILAGAHRLWDDEGVIEYGEWCLPYRYTIGYEYAVDAPTAND